MFSPKKIGQIIKSITAGEIFKACPQVEQYLRGGQFWTDGYFVGRVGAHGNKQTTRKYVWQQGKPDENGQLKLF
jgi:putative transposase